MAMEEMEAKRNQGECGAPSSNFWNRLNTLPIVHSTVKSTVDLYSTSKEKSPIIGKGLGYLEYGVSMASAPVVKAATNFADKYPVAYTTATKLDSLACHCLETIEKKAPIIQKPPEQVVKRVKKGASTAMHSGVRKVMKSYPGQQVVKGLDTMINWSENTLDQYEEKQEETELEANDQKDDQNDSKESNGSLMLKLQNGKVVPIRIYLQILKIVKNMLANMAGVKLRPAAASSPCRPRDLDRRRKASPRKRLPKEGLVSRLTGGAMSMLGWKKQETHSGENIYSNLKPSNAALDEASGQHQKRKHEDMADESDVESLNLASALDQYDSADDSDYFPEEDPTEDSLEYRSGDAESYLESEDADLSTKGDSIHQLADNQEENEKPSKVQLSSIKSPQAENDGKEGNDGTK